MQNLKRSAKKAIRIWAFTAQIDAAFRARILIWQLVDTFRLIVFPIVWIAALQGEAIEGYERDSIITYFLGIFIVNQLVYRHGYTWMNKDIKDGMLSTFLVRPLHYIRWIGTQEIGSISKPLVSLPIVIIFILLLQEFILLPGSLLEGVLTTLAIGCAIIMNLSISHILGMVTFWLEENQGVQNMWWAAHVVFAGGVAPLALLPEIVEKVAFWTPFRYSASFPVELWLGRLSSEETLAGFGIILIWIPLLWGVSKFLWQRGVKRYSGIGM